MSQIKDRPLNIVLYHSDNILLDIIKEMTENSIRSSDPRYRSNIFYTSDKSETMKVVKMGGVDLVVSSDNYVPPASKIKSRYKPHAFMDISDKESSAEELAQEIEKADSGVLVFRLSPTTSEKNRNITGYIPYDARSIRCIVDFLTPKAKPSEFRAKDFVKLQEAFPLVTFYR